MNTNNLDQQKKLRELKDFFENRGISQKKIAELLEISPATVSAYLGGLRAFGKYASERWAGAFGPICRLQRLAPLYALAIKK